MRAETIKRIKLIAEEGMVLTNGESYGTEIFIAEDASVDEYREITEAEYQEILAKKSREELGGVE